MWWFLICSSNQGNKWITKANNNIIKCKELTSNTINISGRTFSFSRLCAWAKLRGYPSKSHPFSFASCCDNRVVTIYNKLFIFWTIFIGKQRKIRQVSLLYNTAVTISSGTRRPVFMYSFALFPISVPVDTSSLRRSPVDMWTSPNCNRRSKKKMKYINNNSDKEWGKTTH